MSIRNEIVEYMAGRPAWQVLAVRYLLQKGAIDDDDLNTLMQTCTAPHAGVVSAPIDPLEPDEFGLGAEDPHVRLLGISHISGVNALTSDEALSVGEDGLTIVYGTNGAGKTGYVRLLKQFGRARGGPTELLPNIYSSETADPSATIHYRCGESDCTYDWKATSIAPRELRAISIFDQESAAVYVSSNNEAEYLPHCLDLLPRLAEVCDALRQRIDSQVRGLESRAVTLPSVPAGTAADRLLSQLNRSDAHELVNAVARLSAVETERLSELNRTLGALDPLQRASELELRAARLTACADQIGHRAAMVCEEREDDLRLALNVVADATVRLGIASVEAFRDEPVPGSGSDPWHRLWVAAREYSSEVGLVFPPFGGETCVLCQQTIEEIAADRMRRFEEFVTSKLEEELAVARQRVNRLISDLRVPPEDLIALYAQDIEISDPTLVDEFRQILTVMEERRLGLIGLELDSSGHVAAEVDADRFIRALRACGTMVTQDATKLRSSVDPVIRAALIAEREELEARRVLSDRRSELLAEATRLTEIGTLQRARRDTVTTGISRRNSELTEQYLTAELAERFREVMEALGFDHIPIKVSNAGGRAGTAYHQLNLDAASGATERPIKVLSQGENRCVALAAFLAEISLSADRSTVVFDDPVSSLDHDRRNQVAERLAEVAESRPVVIFTHDLVFLFSLQRAAETVGVPVTHCRVHRNGRDAGTVRSGVPWQGATTKNRIGHLRSLLQQARATQKKGEMEAYERQAKEIYGYLRDAWEQAVEEVLLNGAICRFMPDVQTKRLRRLANIAEEHMQLLEAQMSKTSRWLPGHSTPAAVVDPTPTPDEVLKDIEALSEWRTAVSAIHK